MSLKTRVCPESKIRFQTGRFPHDFLLTPMGVQFILNPPWSCMVFWLLRSPHGFTNPYSQGFKFRTPVNIPIPTKIGSKMGDEFTYPKLGSVWFWF